MTMDQELESAKTVTTIVYGLQAVSLLLGITYVIAVIINYAKRDDVRGIWLESHFRWQIRTFWFSLIWAAVGFATPIIGLGYLILLANTLWIIYRIVKGWLRLIDRKAMYL